MTQNVLDYSENPSGIQLMDKFLAGMADNQLTNHSGVSRPSYAKAGTFWIDTSATPWVLKQFTGSGDVILGTLDQTGLVFTARRALQDGSGNTITSTYLKKTDTAAKATADASGNTITSTYLKKTDTAARATADADGNTISSTYLKTTGDQEIAGTKTFYNAIKARGGFDVINTVAVKGTNPTSAIYWGLFRANDGLNTTWQASRLAIGELSLSASGETILSLGCYKNEANSTANSMIKTGYSLTSGAWASAPTPSSATDNSTKIATTAWVNNAKSMIVGWSIPDRAKAVSVSTGASYTAPSNGWLYVNIIGQKSTYEKIEIDIGGFKYNYGRSLYDNSYEDITAEILVKKGDVCKFTVTGTWTVKFIPCKGV